MIPQVPSSSQYESSIWLLNIDIFFLNSNLARALKISREKKKKSKGVLKASEPRPNRTGRFEDRTLRSVQVRALEGGPNRSSVRGSGSRGQGPNRTELRHHYNKQPQRASSSPLLCDTPLLSGPVGSRLRHIHHSQLATYNIQPCFSPRPLIPERGSNRIPSLIKYLWQQPLATTSLVLVVARLRYE
ncbi:hypothetical protein SISSUDRAFT_735744 [Sistotremastrum suecicum HHB10207 ss-3]|uniref:Uncharacterized protein n=1 Tax=Sistotremastrum suecicum HHB10207 ss-3 TaxID=1314776 RepID=A0A165WPW6_9AGAM|nr:hypothetical protein SISSUDRAFT_735744 [Sistotremastrum suecicum HHB10207 ss-3]